MSGRGRRLAAASTAAAAGIALLAADAHADPRTFQVTLVTGQTITITVDVPPGTPVDGVPVPTITTPVGTIAEQPHSSDPPGARTPQPTPTPGAQPRPKSTA